MVAANIKSNENWGAAVPWRALGMRFDPVALSGIGQKEFNAIATQNFLALIGKRLGSFAHDHTAFLKDLEITLVAGANPNCPHRSDRSEEFAEPYRSPARSGETAWDFYSKLAKFYDKFLSEEREGEQMSAKDEQVLGMKLELCTNVVSLLEKFGGCSSNPKMWNWVGQHFASGRLIYEPQVRERVSSVIPSITLKGATFGSKIISEGVGKFSTVEIEQD